MDLGYSKEVFTELENSDSLRSLASFAFLEKEVLWISFLPVNDNTSFSRLLVVSGYGYNTELYRRVVWPSAPICEQFPKRCICCWNYGWKVWLSCNYGRNCGCCGQCIHTRGMVMVSEVLTRYALHPSPTSALMPPELSRHSKFWQTTQADSTWLLLIICKF